MRVGTKIQFRRGVTKPVYNTEIRLGGQTGVVTHLDTTMLRVALDEYDINLAEWDNELIWTSADVANELEWLFKANGDVLDELTPTQMACEFAAFLARRAEAIGFDSTAGVDVEGLRTAYRAMRAALAATEVYTNDNALPDPTVEQLVDHAFNLATGAGWNWESSPSAADFFAKATHVEILNYAILELESLLQSVEVAK